MTSGSRVLVLDEILVKDQLACQIADWWLQWDMRRQVKVSEWEEIQRYVFATDTRKTTNAKLPWSNKTTIPKLAQIRDNLFANYMASMFPKRKWLSWEGETESDEDEQKKKSIESYMAWVIDRNEFYDEITKAVLDYIDYGNVFVMPVWVDQRIELEDKTTAGYVGPALKRISPLDIVFNPTVTNFADTPKIIRSLVSLGEIKEMLESFGSTPEEQQEARELWDYMDGVRRQAAEYPSNSVTKDAIFNVAGFDSFNTYLQSGYVEILTFYGDAYIEGDDKLLENHVIKVIDRHKILSKKPNPSFFGTAPIYHAGWRVRPDNLWAMGPLDNLVGMQYRIDHLENMKADLMDLITYPPLKVRGYVEDFDWGPFERIYVGDDGDVELMSPDVQALQVNTEIAILEQKMEEMSGSPREAMGFRTPGEKTKYEVQRLENAAARIFESKIAQFERQLVEQVLNGMLELARRNMDLTTIRVLDDEWRIAGFESLTKEDITGAGRIRPMAARHFAEQAQLVQDLTQFFSSVPGSDPSIIAHFSSVGLARLFENILNIEEFKIVQPYVRISEQGEAQQLMAIQQEQMASELTTPGGMMEGDYDPDMVGEANPNEVPETIQ